MILLIAFLLYLVNKVNNKRIFAEEVAKLLKEQNKKLRNV
jgi:hypothetical protein